MNAKGSGPAIVLEMASSMSKRATRQTIQARAPVAVRRHVPQGRRREQILDAAAELFSQRGFAGTTTRQIAAAVGTSETVLFRHFPSKESLYAAILEHRIPSAEVERWLEDLRTIAGRRDDDALFTAVVEALLGSYRTNPVYHRLTLFAALEDRELARVAQVKYTMPIASFLCEYVSRRQAEGAFRRVRPEFVVHMLFSVTCQYALWNALGVNPLGLTDQEVATQAVALIAGLRSAPEPADVTPDHIRADEKQVLASRPRRP
jgi:TetR/AcrR family transcriptional regulator